MNPFRRFLEVILKHRACPHCGAREAGYEGRADELDRAIVPGMFVVCVECAGLILVGRGREFRAPAPGDLRRLERSPVARLIRREQDLVRRNLECLRAMEARGRRGHLEGHEHWDCPSCRTANYGENCTRCGGPAPWRRP